MSFTERMPFLSHNVFLFQAERIKKNERKKNTSRIKIFLKDLSTHEFLAYFDSRKDYAPKIKSTLRNLDNKPLLYILKSKVIQGRLRIWFFSLDENTEAGEDLDESSSSFIGEIVRHGKIPTNKFDFILPNGEMLFSVKPNLTGTQFLFEKSKSEGSHVLAEGNRKIMTTWGWDWEFTLKINPLCDKLTRAFLICSMRAIAPTFYPK